ncbi:MAG: PAS domain S-box protein, partial [Candidatus Eremiobacterota bacterium]
DREIELHRIIVNNMAEGVCIIRESDGIIIYANQKFEKIFGYSSGELKGQHVNILNYSEGTKSAYETYLEIADKITAHGEATCEVHNVKKDGTPFWCKATTSLYNHPEYGKVYVAVQADITESKNIEEELHRSEKKYRELIELSIEGIWMIDSEGYTNFVNSSICDLLCYSKEEMLGKHLFFFMDESSIETAKMYLKRRSEGIGEQHEFQFLRKNGSSVCTLISTAPVTDDERNYKGAIAFISDITERKKTEEALKEAMFKYQLLFDSETDAVILVDRETCDILEANKACQDMYCYSKEELLSMKHFELSAEPEKAISAIKELSMLFFPLRYHKKKDGTIFPVEVMCNKFNLNGRPVMLADIRDITERVKMEEALSYRFLVEKILADIAGRFINVKSSDVDMELKVSLKTIGEFLNFDRTYIILFSPETGDFIKAIEWIEKSIDSYIEKDLFLLSIKDFKWVYSKLKKGECILVPKLSDLPAEAEYEKKFWSGKQIKSLIAVPMISGEKLSGFLGFSSIKKERNWKHDDLNFIRLLGEFFTNVLERKRMEEKLRKNEEKLKKYSELLKEMVKNRTKELEDAQEKLVRQEKLAVLGKLAGSVGHELRNPLGVISNAVYYLQMAYSSADEKLKDYLSIISEEVKKSDKIISDLLDFSRIKSIDKVNISLNEVFSELFRVYPVPENIQVINRISTELPCIYGDRNHIIQILGNLIINAFQAMPAGGVLTMDGEVSLCGVRVSVSDTGCGIPKDNINKIFEPLFTTKPRGIGLGLCVCKNLLDANRGKIEVESVENKGAVFTVTLPVKEVG